MPAASTVPVVLLPPATPLTFHVTAVFEVPVTVAVNAFDCPVKSVAEVGLMLTVTGGGGGVLLPPPQAGKISVLASSMQMPPTIHHLARAFDLRMPARKMPGIAHGSHTQLNCFREAEPGPAVTTLMVTDVVPLPAGIWEGWKEQLLCSGAGAIAHDRLTEFRKVVPPTGVTVRV